MEETMEDGSERWVISDAALAYRTYQEYTRMGPDWQNLELDQQEGWRLACAALREIEMCPVHAQLDAADKLEPFTQCIACTRVEVGELKKQIREMKAFTNGLLAGTEMRDRSVQVGTLEWMLTGMMTLGQIMVRASDVVALLENRMAEIKTLPPPPEIEAHYGAKE